MGIDPGGIEGGGSAVGEGASGGPEHRGGDESSGILEGFGSSDSGRGSAISGKHHAWAVAVGGAVAWLTNHFAYIAHARFPEVEQGAKGYSPILGSVVTGFVTFLQARFLETQHWSGEMRRITDLMATTREILQAQDTSPKMRKTMEKALEELQGQQWKLQARKPSGFWEGFFHHF